MFKPKTKLRLKRTLSGALALAMTASIAAVMPAAAEETVKYPYAIFAGDGEGGVELNSNNICINGDICVNGSLNYASNNTNFNGIVNSNQSDEEMVYAHQRILECYFPDGTDFIDFNVTDSDTNINIDNSTYAQGYINYSGSVNLSKSIGAYRDISIDGENINSGDIAIYSKYGDINFDSNNSVSINGLIYAPNGDITIDTNNFQLNGIIIAENITIEADNININYNSDVAEKFGTTSTNTENTEFLVDGLEDLGEMYYKPSNVSEFDYYEGLYFVKNQFLLTAKEDVSVTQVEDFISNYDGKIVGRIQISDEYQVTINHDISISELLEIIDAANNSDLFDYASLNTVFLESDSSEPYYPTDPWDGSSALWDETSPNGVNWNLEAINVPSAWNVIDDTQSVKIGIFDSCIDGSHIELSTSLKKIWNESKGFDKNDNPHGTHIAGIIAAKENHTGITGILKNCDTIYAFDSETNKFNSDSQYSYLVDFRNNITPSSCEIFRTAIEYKYVMAKLIGNNVKVVNISKTTGRIQSFLATNGDLDSLNYINTNAEIMGLFFNRMLNNNYDFNIVIAAGNDNDKIFEKDNKGKWYIKQEIDPDSGNKVDATYKDDTRNNICAEYSNFLLSTKISDVQNRIICVGAIEHMNSEFYVTSYSNVGGKVDVVAPGEKIYSTIFDNKYGDMSGTSMAAPHVTGIAGLLYSVNPNLSGEQVKNIIVSTSVPINNKSSDGHIYNIVNAYSAVLQAKIINGDSHVAEKSNGIVIGNILDSETNETISGVDITATYVDTFGNVLDNKSYEMYTGDNNQFEFSLPAGIYRFTYSKNGYMGLDEIQEVCENETTYLEPHLMISDKYAKTEVDVSGSIKNALNGHNITQGTIYFREGWSKRNTDVINYCSINSSGKYKITLSSGYYTAEIVSKGYIVNYVNIAVNPINTSNKNFVLTPKLDDDEYRIVLTWGKTPSDLDSHLYYESNNINYHVYFAARDQAFGDTSLSLDLDDRNGEGPETITIKNMNKNDSFTYTIHDYSNSGRNNSKMLSLSGANVKVYGSNGLLAVFNVPYNTAGTTWTVFQMNNGAIEPLNFIK